ncbi:hypothetical protein [Nocardioides dongkuii]|uniref:hypothetical protein n=1 Tax=Nocardioides dongkuii TaxID=2760089 RepID=UPI0015FCCDAB|nr:hypothetical protein [Nocardioides dongkuii]
MARAGPGGTERSLETARLLALQIAPRQAEAIADPDGGARLRALGMLSGILNLLWVAVVVLMIVRPGSASA